MAAPSPAPSGRHGAPGSRARQNQRPRVRFRAVDGLAVIGLSLTLALMGCTEKVSDQHNVTMPTSTGSTASTLVTSAPLETATAAQTLPVYWLGRSNDDVFLYREFFPTAATDDPIVSALHTMMSAKPSDPDYFSLWNKPSRLGASISAKNVITIDVSADAFGQNMDQGIADRSVSQLVYTATAAAAMAGLIDASSAVQVSVLVDGHTGFNAFGHVALDKPLTRNPAFVAPVWLIDPANGATYRTLPLKVKGQGVSPTGTLAWALSHVKNGEVSDVYMTGTVSIPQGPSELGEFNFNLVPPPGSYQLSVYLADPLVPGRQIGLDTKIVTISQP
ncbi:GerMN domain-containing protein [Arthrobacter sp. HLT1-20]